MRRTCMIALAMYSCLAGQTAPAQESGYSDDEVKLQYVEAGMFCHAEFIKRGCQRAFEMAGFDTNRYARILRELAVENTNGSLWSTGHEVDIRNRRSDEQFHSCRTRLSFIDKRCCPC